MIFSLPSFSQNIEEEIDLDDLFKEPTIKDLIDNHEQILYADKLLSIAHKLNGTWKLKGNYTNGILRKDTLRILSSNTVTNYEIQTDSGIVQIEVTNNIVQRIALKKSLEVIEFNNGNGTLLGYQHYNEYVPNREWQQIETCQPIPQVVRYNEEYYLFYVGMFGDWLQKIKYLDDSKLIFEKSDSVDVTYERLEKK